MNARRSGDRRCGACATPIPWQIRETTIYCSAACRAAARRARIRPSTAHVRTATATGERRCGTCSTTLPSRMRAHALYCSPACRVAAHRASTQRTVRQGHASDAVKKARATGSTFVFKTLLSRWERLCEHNREVLAQTGASNSEVLMRLDDTAYALLMETLKRPHRPMHLPHDVEKWLTKMSATSRMFAAALRQGRRDGRRPPRPPV